MYASVQRTLTNFASSSRKRKMFVKAEWVCSVLKKSNEIVFISIVHYSVGI